MPVIDALQTVPPSTWRSRRKSASYFRDMAGLSQMQGKGSRVRERAAVCELRICANAPLTDRTDRYELIRSRAGRRKQLLPLYESRR